MLHVQMLSKNDGNIIYEHCMRVCTMVLSVGLVEAFRVNEAQVLSVLRGQQVERGGAVGHQGVITVAHPHVALQRR